MCFTSVNQEAPGAKVVVIFLLKSSESDCTVSITGKRANKYEPCIHIYRYICI